METDPEVSGDGNSYTTMFRQYDPRLGRWKSLDPLAGKYPGQSPFAAYNNNPVYFVDPLGLEGVDPISKAGEKANDSPAAIRGNKSPSSLPDNKDVQRILFEYDPNTGYEFTSLLEDLTWLNNQQQNISTIGSEIIEGYEAMKAASEDINDMRLQNDLISWMSTHWGPKIITELNEAMLVGFENYLYSAQGLFNGYILTRNDLAKLYNQALDDFKAELSRVQSIKDTETGTYMMITPEGSKPAITIIVGDESFSFGSIPLYMETQVFEYQYLDENWEEFDDFKPNIFVPGIDIDNRKTENDDSDNYKGKGGPDDKGPWRPTNQNPERGRQQTRYNQRTDR